MKHSLRLRLSEFLHCGDEMQWFSWSLGRSHRVATQVTLSKLGVPVLPFCMCYHEVSIVSMSKLTMSL